MQNLKHVHSGCCHIKVRREFRDIISCLGFNIPQLHLLVKLLSPYLRYLRGGKKKGLKKEGICMGILTDMQCT